MPIVINEFELVVERSEPSSAGSTARESHAEQAPPLRPDEIVAVMQLDNERLRRVRAD
ncbi:MAG TPA: hypothetical protein VHQ94_06035 [Pyrinomonadaceae bacterium]|jgi:hypothetical protein|nr:hypothetical protein [Pyrinomonadaceae bacterium]